MELANLIVIMGSKSDMEIAEKVKVSAEQFGLTVSLHIASAHKTAHHLLKILDEYEAQNNAHVYVTIAGRSNALSGFVDGYVNYPVIACPPASAAFGGADIFSSLRMPSGVAPAVVLEPENAALLAAKILSMNDASIKDNVTKYKAKQMEKIIKDDRELNGK